jgi:hypothetical protein
MNLTDWYEGWQKPVRVGVYRRIGRSYSYFDAACWYAVAYSPRSALTNYQKNLRSFMQDLPWRGLASDPNSGGKTVAILGQNEAKSG